MNNSEFDDIIQAVNLLAEYDGRWMVCGGWAIDLYLNRLTRPHKDIDFVILHRDQLKVQEYLSLRGWTLEKAISGQLHPWSAGEWIDLPVHTIWCRNLQASPDFIELLFNETDETNFLFRRDFSITLPLGGMILSSSSGIPILAPEIVLLYKSMNPTEPNNTVDFTTALPKLSPVSRGWFEQSLRKLNSNHSWLENL